MSQKYNKDTRSGYFTHAASGKTCPLCEQNIHPGQIIGMSFLVPESERKWLCHSCAVAEVGIQ